MNRKIDLGLQNKFSHIQQNGCGNDGVRKIHIRLNDEFHLGGEDDLKNLISKIYISNCFAEDKSILALDEVLDSLSHYAKLFIDVNGLKAVNDWAGHSKGDILLKRIVECLMYDEQIIGFIKEYNFQFPQKSEDGSFIFVPYEDMRKIDAKKSFFQVFREGGDEFSMLVYCPDHSLNSLIVLFRKLIMDCVQSIDISDLITVDCIVDKLDVTGLLLYNATGGKFKYCASVACGETSFDKVLNEYLENHDVTSMEYNQDFFGDTLMGAVQNFVDKQTTDRKIEYKQILSRGSDVRRFEGYLITRSDEARYWFGIAAEMQREATNMVKNFYDTHRKTIQQIEEGIPKDGFDEDLAKKLTHEASSHLNLFVKAFQAMLSRTIEGHR